MVWVVVSSNATATILVYACDSLTSQANMWFDPRLGGVFLPPSVVPNLAPNRLQPSSQTHPTPSNDQDPSTVSKSTSRWPRPHQHFFPTPFHHLPSWLMALRQPTLFSPWHTVCLSLCYRSMIWIRTKLVRHQTVFTPTRKPRTTTLVTPMYTRASTTHVIHLYHKAGPTHVYTSWWHPSDYAIRGRSSPLPIRGSTSPPLDPTEHFANYQSPSFLQHNTTQSHYLFSQLSTSSSSPSRFSPGWRCSASSVPGSTSSSLIRSETKTMTSPPQDICDVTLPVTFLHSNTYRPTEIPTPISPRWSYPHIYKPEIPLCHTIAT